jgi:hypothetical protein
VSITKAGFRAVAQEDVIVRAGASAIVLTYALQSASMTSLLDIAHITVSAHGENKLNTTPAAVGDIPASRFQEQGQLSVNQVLNEEPGVTVGLGDVIDTSLLNGASPLSAGIPSVRGGLPYETESLIDGHAISLGQTGTFSPSFISPYLLQNVEVVKGPGATSPSINYAINGTINYRSLEPTLKPQSSIDLGLDQFGGTFANLRATGTTPGKFSYALDYITQGTDGPNPGFTAPIVFFPGGPTFLNGRPISPYAGYTVGPGAPNVIASFKQAMSFVMCCETFPQWFNQRNQLAKVRYSFSPGTALTVSWLGGQTSGAEIMGFAAPCINLSFIPPAGYTGSLKPGPITAFSGLENGWLAQQNTNLFETEFHTPIGKTATLQVRQYSSSIHTFQYGPGNSGPTAAGLSSNTGQVYGGVYFGSSKTPTIFDGQLATISAQQYVEQRSFDNLNGYTVELEKQAGDNLLTLSYDEASTSTDATQDFYGTYTTLVPGGSSQRFQSIMARAQLQFGPGINATLSDNFGLYTDTYSQDGGTSYLRSTHAYNAPRLSATWRPTANQSIRAALGLSVAPPYINLLNNQNVVNAATGAPPPYFTTTGNSGDVLPETAFGFNLGFDTRVNSPFTVLSLDLYQTTLHDQFLQSTFGGGQYTCTKATHCADKFAYGDTGPLYITKTSNIGHSKYEGIELTFHRSPPAGPGFRLQGSLQRAYVYDLPAGFYDTGAGPNTANLGILPGVNFQSSGIGYNGMSYTRIPYSMGYGELNYRGRNGAYGLIGVTYYGPNNSYAEPAFGVMNASYQQPITSRAWVQLTINNLTGAYSKFYPTFDATKLLTPLRNGQVGSVYANVIGPTTASLMIHEDLW